SLGARSVRASMLMDHSLDDAEFAHPMKSVWPSSETLSGCAHWWRAAQSLASTTKRFDTRFYGPAQHSACSSGMCHLTNGDRDERTTICLGFANGRSAPIRW